MSKIKQFKFAYSMRFKTFKFDATLLFKDDISLRSFTIDNSGLYIFVEEISHTPLKDHNIGMYELFTGNIVRKI